MCFISWQNEPKRRIEGLATAYECPNCRNVTVWQLIHYYSSSTLYWIIPLGTSKHVYRTECPICGVGVEMNRKEFNKRKDPSTVIRLGNANENAEETACGEEGN